MSEITTPLQAAQAMAAGAGPTNSTKCFATDHYVFWLPDTEARVPGHIYSELGRKEFFISNCCEYCFDSMFPGDEEEDEAPTEEEFKAVRHAVAEQRRATA